MIKKPFVLITRPKAEAEKTAEKMNAKGIDSFIESLLDIEFITGTEKPLMPLLRGKPQAIITTSINGILSLDKINCPKEVSLYVVGSESAETAKSHGFTNVIAAAGSVDDLILLISKKLKPLAGYLIYACAEITAKNLAEQLQNKGFEVHSIVTYRANPVIDLSEECINHIKYSVFDFVTFFSRRTTENFISLIEKNDLSEYAKELRYVCLSENISKPLRKKGFNNIMLAKEISSDSLLELITNFEFTK